MFLLWHRIVVDSRVRLSDNFATDLLTLVELLKLFLEMQ